MREMQNTGVVWLPVIPSDWKIDKVKNCFTISKDLSTENEPTVLKLARSGVQVRDVTNNEGQMAASYDNYNKVQPGDLLLNPMDLYSGANCNMSEISGVISPAYANLRPKKDVNSKYFDYYFKTQYWAMAMFAHGKGISYDNRWTINNDSIKNYEIPVPSISEQNKIVDCINTDTKTVDTLIANQEQQIEKLKAYKQSLITEVVTKGLNPDVPTKDTGVDWLGKIPEDWETMRLKYIGAAQNGISKGGESFGSGYPFVSYGDVYNNYALPLSVSGLVESTEQERKIYSVRAGDIFFTRTSETIEEVGFSCVCNSDIDNAVFAGFVIRFRPFKPDDALLTEFAKYYFKGQHIRKYLVKEMNLVTRASLSQGLLLSMTVLLPSKEEQKQIVEYLDEKCAKIDRLIEIKQQKIEKLNKYKKSLIYEYVTGKKEVI